MDWRLICLHISLDRVGQRAFQPGAQVAECRNKRLLMLTFALLKTFPCTTGCHLSAWVPLQATLSSPSSSQALEVILSLFLVSRVRRLCCATVRLLICYSWLLFPEHTDRTASFLALVLPKPPYTCLPQTWDCCKHFWSPMLWTGSDLSSHIPCQGGPESVPAGITGCRVSKPEVVDVDLCTSENFSV